MSENLAGTGEGSNIFTGCTMAMPDGSTVPIPDGEMTSEAFADFLQAERIAYQSRSANDDLADVAEEWARNKLKTIWMGSQHQLAAEAFKQGWAAREQEIVQLRRERDNAAERIRLAREALLADGYFRPDEVGDDIAPRIIERLSAQNGDEAP